MNEEQNINQLPKDWEQKQFNEVAKLVRGVSYDKQYAYNYPGEGLLPIIRATNIQDGLVLEGFVYVPEKIVKEEQLIKEGDILLAMSSGSKELVGKSAQARQDHRLAFGTFCGLIRPNEKINKRFFGYFFQTRNYRNYVSSISKGVGINNLRRNHIEDLMFPIPPAQEQATIVLRIEELFSEIDKGIEEIKTAQQQLKVYQQAVLKWAFEGKLTNENLKDGELPKEWRSEELGNVSESCLGKMLDKQKNKGILRPYLGNINVRWGEFDLADLKLMAFEDSELARFSLTKGDLVICEGGEPGRCAIWKSDSSTVMIQKALHRVRVFNHVDVRYVYYFLSFSSMNGSLAKYFTGTTIKHLTGKELKKIQLPIPPLEEQQQIVQEIESRLSVCDKIEETITNNLKQAEALRQSILKKAFEGRLSTDL